MFFARGAELLTFSDYKDFHACLEKEGLPLRKWGKGVTKSPKRLWDEKERGESLFARENDILTRGVTRVQARIFHRPTNQFLIEVRQVYHTSKGDMERTRSRKVSVSEKMLPEEIRSDAILRCLVEELSFRREQLDDLVLGEFNTYRKEPSPSNSYPSLMTRRRNYRCDIELPTSLYVPDGYIETQEGYRTSYFGWTPFEDM